jgi:hypothetical protein
VSRPHPRSRGSDVDGGRTEARTVRSIPLFPIRSPFRVSPGRSQAATSTGLVGLQVEIDNRHGVMPARRPVVFSTPFRSRRTPPPYVKNPLCPRRDGRGFADYTRASGSSWYRGGCFRLTTPTHATGSASSCNPLGVEEGVSGVGSEGPRKTSSYRAVCAGVAVHVHLESSRRDVSAFLFSVTPENTDSSANARGPGVTRGVTPPRRCRIQRPPDDFNLTARNSDSTPL